jgi:hypothetical protein
VGAGSVRLQHIDGQIEPAVFESLTPRIIAVYRESWKSGSTDRFAGLGRPEAFSGFARLLLAFAKRGGLHALFATVDGEDAAFYVGVRFGQMYCSLQTAYREKHAARSLGFLVQMEDFRYTLERGLTNNLMAYQEYKTHLTDRVVRFASLTAYSRGAHGRMAHLLAKARRGLKALLART